MRFQVIDPEDMSQRARWTIIATACLLLLMCLLLVGVTLRMAPLIDDMGKSSQIVHSRKSCFFLLFSFFFIQNFRDKCRGDINNIYAFASFHRD